jgi:hypothetical protein
VSAPARSRSRHAALVRGETVNAVWFASRGERVRRRLLFLQRVPGSHLALDADHPTPAVRLNDAATSC